MANKQTDPVQILANNIVDTMSSIANSRSDKAPFDKSFYATILGVNQSFTADVSDDDQAALIEKFSLPETVEDGENSYYIFKINGAYYCKSQNGDFKLYDPIIVYIPNGDWSRMYIDYDYGSGSGRSSSNSSGSLRRIVVDVEAPGGDDPQLGNIWFRVNDDSITEFTEIPVGAFTSLYIYREDEDTKIKDWINVKCPISKDLPPSHPSVGDYYIEISDDNKLLKLLMCTSASDSSSTWAEVYPESETGTDYNFYMSLDKPISAGDIWIKVDDMETLNILSCSVWDFIDENQYGWYLLYNDTSGFGVGENVGSHNERFNGYESADGSTIMYGDYNHAEGYKHTLISCNKTHVTGGENTAVKAEGALIFGEENYSASGGNRGFLLGGYSNDAEGCAISGSAVLGMNNTLRATFANSLLLGASNTISGDVTYSVVIGNGHTVTGGSGDAIFGQGHKVVYGTGGINHILVCGTAADTTTLNVGAGNIRFLVGNAGNIFCIDGDGAAYAHAGYHAMGADYAEYFEWADGNPDNEKRYGLLVSLDGDKIVLADGTDDILGVVSSSPSVAGNSAEMCWKGKYERDVYGKTITTSNGEPIISSDYDPECKYIPRSQRPEWSVIGLMGRLVVRDRGDCRANDYICADNGYAFPCLVGKTNIRCLKRIDDTHIEVLVK